MGWANAVPATDVYDVNVPEYIPNSQWTMEISYSNIFPEYQGYVWYYKDFEIEAVLCNEDVLAPGDYSAQAYIRG